MSRFQLSLWYRIMRVSKGFVLRDIPRVGNHLCKASLLLGMHLAVLRACFQLCSGEALDSARRCCLGVAACKAAPQPLHYPSSPREIWFLSLFPWNKLHTHSIACFVRKDVFITINFHYRSQFQERILKCLLWACLDSSLLLHGVTDFTPEMSSSIQYL